MKNYLVAGLIGLVTVFVLTSCNKIKGSGPEVTEERSLEAYSAIAAEFPGDVLITYGNAYKLSIEGQQNIIDELETVVTNNLLTIKFKKNNIIKNADQLTVRITTPDIKSLRLNGSGNMMVHNTIESNQLSLSIYGSGNMHLAGVAAQELSTNITGSGNLDIGELSAELLDASITGSGDMEVNGGTVTDEKIKVTGSGNIELLSLRAANSEVQLTASGNVRIWVTDHLKVKITGSGSVYYKGEPSVDEVTITGSGRLKKL